MTSINKNTTASRLLLIILPLLAVVITFFIVKSDDKGGLLFIIGILGLALTIFSLFYPTFGFYYTIIVTFFLFDIKRLVEIDFPLGTYIDILIFILFAGILIRKVVNKEPFWKNCNHVLIIAYFISFLYSVLEIFNPNSISQELTFTIFRRYLTLQLFFYCSIQIFDDVRSINRYFKVFLFFSIIAGIYACYQQWFGYPQYELNYILSSPLLIGLYSLDNGDFRKFSFLSDPTAFGILMAAVSVVVIIFLLHIKDNGKKLLLGSGLIIFLLAMSYSGTRTAYAAVVAGLGLYVLMTLSNRRTLLFASFAFIFLLAILYAPIYGNVTINRIRSTFQFSKDASYQVRDVNRHSVQPYLRSHPIGGGIGTTGLLNMKQNSNHPLAGFPTDSGFLRGALELGWIGLIIQCALYFLILQQGIHAYYRSKTPEVRSLLLVATVTAFCYIIAHYAQIAIGPVPGAFLFYPLLAIIVRLGQIEKNKLINSDINLKLNK